MKTRFVEIIALLALMAALSSTAFAQDNFPNLVGKWTGTKAGHSQVTGFVNSESGNLLDIKEQKGRIFIGTQTFNHLDIKKGGKPSKLTEKISGAISSDGKTIYISDPDGIILGNILSEDNIELFTIQNNQKEGQLIIYSNYKRMNQ
jgi:hypothetical protein